MQNVIDRTGTPLRMNLHTNGFRIHQIQPLELNQMPGRSSRKSQSPAAGYG
jgi:hypothetical protein